MLFWLWLVQRRLARIEEGQRLILSLITVGEEDSAALAALRARLKARRIALTQALHTTP